MSGEPLGLRELSSLCSLLRAKSAGWQGAGRGVCVLGAAAWESTLHKAQREALGLGETWPHVEGQGCRNLHISI